MKISRINVDRFSIEESPTINRDNIGGEDLLFFGGNRSGKTLTFNAVLYGLYGREATFDVSPGRGADTAIYFDSGDVIRRSDTHTYQRNGDDYSPDAIREYVGPEDIVKLQFLHSNVNNQPLSELKEQELLDIIRTTLSSDLQIEIDRHTAAKSYLEHRIEMVSRGDGKKPSLSEMKKEKQNINIGEMENRLEKIEHLWSLFESGEIVSIRDRLQRDDEISSQLKELTKRRRKLRDELRQTKRELRETERYTDKVNNIIIDAMEELPCPICDSLVSESTAEDRLTRGDCPHCGQSRSISDLKSDIRKQVDQADEAVEPLKEKIENLESEISDIDDKITELRDEEPELEEVDSLVEKALDNADYDIDIARDETKEWLEEYKADIEADREHLQELEERIERRESEIEKYEESIEIAKSRIDELTSQSFEEEVREFQEQWSENYQMLAPELSANITIDPEGEVRIPGTGPNEPRVYDQLSSGEQRLLNISFAFTLAQLADRESNKNHCEVLIMDEPLTNVEEEIKKSVIASLLDSDVQCIITTSNEQIRSLFRSRNVKNLDRIELEPTTLEQFA